MYEEARRMMEQKLGLTDEEFRTHISFPHNRKIIEHFAELGQYYIIAEVVEAVHCSSGLKPGQKFVFKAFPAKLIVEESTAALCARALGPVTMLIQGFWERIYENLDPNGGIWQTAECQDPGIARGGLGNVIFKVYAQKAEKK